MDIKKEQKKAAENIVHQIGTSVDTIKILRNEFSNFDLQPDQCAKILKQLRHNVEKLDEIGKESLETIYVILTKDIRFRNALIALNNKKFNLTKKPNYSQKLLKLLQLNWLTCGDEKHKQIAKNIQTFLENPTVIPEKVEEKQKPILIWVDDHPENNVEEINFAKQSGVEVITFQTTWKAVQYLHTHPELKDYPPDLFRIITDRSRVEHTRLNTKGEETEDAGQNFIEYVREVLQWKTPILVYCGKLDGMEKVHSPENSVWVTTNPINAQSFFTMRPITNIKFK